MSKLRINELESLETGRSLKVDELAQTFDYEAGIKITSYNQMVRDASGEFWRVSGQVALPYVTTGSGLPEGDALVSASDAVLRRDLAGENGADSVSYLLDPAGAIRTVGDRLRESVSVKDFGAVGDGVTDDTVAFQAAVDYAFANGRSVRVAGGRFLVSQIHLPQNSAEPVEAFWIYGENAAILLKTADYLFTVDGDFFYDLFVRDLSFIGDAEGNFAAIDSKIFDCGKIMRLNVDGCSSVYVNKFFDAPDGAYAQSVYAHQCIYRRGNADGHFFQAQVAFDISLIDCLVEQSYNGLRVVAPGAVGNQQHLSRVTIRGGAWESLFGTAIAAGPCYQLTVDNVYFEGNGADINLSYNPTEAAHLAVTITNNDFYQSPADIADQKYNVIWGVNASKSYRTGGNKSNGRLHDITGSPGYFDFTGDYAALALYTGMNTATVRSGNSPVGRVRFGTKEADWAMEGNDAVVLIPSLGAIELGRIGNADLVNGKIVRPRIAFGGTNPSTSPADYNNTEWCRGSVVHNSVPVVQGAAGSQYIISGWACTASGAPGTWVETRAATGT